MHIATIGDRPLRSASLLRLIVAHRAPANEILHEIDHLGSDSRDHLSHDQIHLVHVPDLDSGVAVADPPAVVVLLCPLVPSQSAAQSQVAPNLLPPGPLTSQESKR